MNTDGPCARFRFSVAWRLREVSGNRATDVPGLQELMEEMASERTYYHTHSYYFVPRLHMQDYRQIFTWRDGRVNRKIDVDSIRAKGKRNV